MEISIQAYLMVSAEFRFEKTIAEDPGFLPRSLRQLIIEPNVSTNCMKVKEIRLRGGRVPGVV